MKWIVSGKRQIIAWTNGKAISIFPRKKREYFGYESGYDFVNNNNIRWMFRQFVNPIQASEKYFGSNK